MSGHPLQGCWGRANSTVAGTPLLASGRLSLSPTLFLKSPQLQEPLSPRASAGFFADMEVSWRKGPDE